MIFQSEECADHHAQSTFEKISIIYVKEKMKKNPIFVYLKTQTLGKWPIQQYYAEPKIPNPPTHTHEFSQPPTRNTTCPEFIAILKVQSAAARDHLSSHNWSQQK